MNRIFQLLVLLVLLYDCEIWAVNSDLKRRIDAFDNKCLHRIIGYYWNKPVLTQQLLRETESKHVACIVCDRRRIWHASLQIDAAYRFVRDNSE